VIVHFVEFSRIVDHQCLNPATF